MLDPVAGNEGQRYLPASEVSLFLVILIAASAIYFFEISLIFSTFAF